MQSGIQRIDSTGGPLTRSAARQAEKLGAASSIILLTAMTVQTWHSETAGSRETQTAAVPAAVNTPGSTAATKETFLAGYVGAPFYDRSDVKLQRPGGTDLTLKALGWDGDALYFPVDGGVRSVQWSSALPSAGFMIDFLHNKAVARLGRGAHGRKLANPVVEEVEATGTIKGQPAPARIKLTDIFERFEFTHGHNVLIFTPMLRLSEILPGVRPYFGAGGGFCLPHVEVRHPGEPQRTDEYQLGGGAAQFVAGLELRSGKYSYFLEYKFIWSSISGALTGDKSWMNFNMPGDLIRQATRWWKGEAPQYGTFQTTLTNHQVVVGAGYWLTRPQLAP